MPHRIHIEDGKAAIMYVGQDPWHGLGTRLERPATAQEAIVAAHLDWAVKKVPLYAWADGLAYPIDGKYTVVPADRWGKEHCPTFGIVSEHYTPLQNREAFEFFDPIVGEGAAIYHTAGALDEGRCVWLLAKLPSSIVVAGKDITEKYLLLSNCHDGTGSVQIKFTPTRVVCHNTLTIALKGGEKAIRVPHTRNIKERLTIARESLRIINDGYEQIERDFNGMVTVQMDESQLAAYLRLVFPDPAKKEERRELDRVVKNRKRAAHYFDKGTGNDSPGVKGTLWAAYNAIAEMVDHGRDKRSAEEHLEYIWFGSGYSIKLRAFEIAKKRMQELQPQR